MRKLFLLLSMLGLSAASHAQAREDADAAARRAQIAAERGQADATFRADEKACYAKFAVNDCLSAAKVRRREVLSSLRRQEIALNDEQRQRKALERERAIEERSSAAKQQEAQQRDSALAQQRDRETSAARKAADRASTDAARPANAADRQAQVARRQAEARAAQSQRAQEAAQNLKKRQERLAEAAQRKANRDKRLAERKKPAAKPLPAPP